MNHVFNFGLLAGFDNQLINKMELCKYCANDGVFFNAFEEVYCDCEFGKALKKKDKSARKKLKKKLRKEDVEDQYSIPVRKLDI